MISFTEALAKKLKTPFEEYPSESIEVQILQNTFSTKFEKFSSKYSDSSFRIFCC